MALKLSDLVKRSIEKGYGVAYSGEIEKPWSKGNGLANESKYEHSESTPNGQNHVTLKKNGDNQTDNQTSNKLVANYKQTSNKLVTNSNKKNINHEHSDDIENNKSVINYEQIDKETSISKDKIYIYLQSLSGIQLLIFNKILSVKVKVNKEYHVQVNTTVLAVELGLSANVLRVSIVRIVAKKLLIRESGVEGRNGYSHFKIPNIVLKLKDEIDQIKNFPKEDNNNNNIIITIIENNENKKNTSCELLKKTSSEQSWWDKLNLTPIEEYGFKHTQFKQLDGMTNFDIVQESINHFGWGLENNIKNAKYKENPSRILLAVLKKGSAWIEDGYKDPQEIAMEKIIENRKKNLERKKQLEKNLYQVTFEEWMASLKQDDVNKIIQPKGTDDITPKEIKLNLYFKNNIWSEIKSKSLESIV